MKIKTLNEWLNESNQGFLEPTEGNLRKYGLDPKRVSINPDGSIDYKGDADLSTKYLPSIPFNFNKVKGDFNCSFNQLVGLAGAPVEVEGNFECHFNQLVSLEGCPEVVGGDFNCYSNHLVNLEGSPSAVEGYFDCSYNQLVSLAGAPKAVKGYFNCWNNQLVSLAGAPDKVTGNFNCSPNIIIYNPTKYKGSFDISQEWHIKDSSGKWVQCSGSDHLRMAFGRLDELSKEEILGIEKGLKKVNLPDDLRRYCEDKLYKFQVKYNPKTKTQKFFHDAEMDDDLLGMI